MINLNGVESHRLNLQFEIEDAIDFIKGVTETAKSVYKLDDPASRISYFNEQAELLLADISTLCVHKEMAGLEVSSSFEKLKSAFRSFLNASKPYVGSEIRKHEFALIQIEAPFMNLQTVSPTMEEIDPIYVPIKDQMNKWIQQIDRALNEAERGKNTEDKKNILYIVKRSVSVEIRGYFSSIKGSLKNRECKNVFLRLESIFDRLVHLQRELSDRSTSRVFKEAFPDLFNNSKNILVSDGNSFIDKEIPRSYLGEPEGQNPLRNVIATSYPPNPSSSLSSLSSSSSSISPFDQLVKEAEKSLPVESPVNTSSSSSSLQTEQAPRQSRKKRTASSRLLERSDTPEVSPTTKKAKVSKKAQRMPSLPRESFGKFEFLDKIVNSLKPEGQRTNKLYISANKYDAFYEEFWGGQNGWIEHFKAKLNNSKNAELKAKYDAYKELSVKERSELFRIQHSKKHETFGSMLFTTKTIPKGAIVGEYVGNLVPKRLQTGGNRYVFEFTKDPKVNSYVIDGERMCNEMAFLVHNSEEYCNTEVVEYFDEQGPHILFIAKEEIPAGHAPSINYSDRYWLELGIEPLCLPH